MRGRGRGLDKLDTCGSTGQSKRELGCGLDKLKQSHTDLQAKVRWDSLQTFLNSVVCQVCEAQSYHAAPSAGL